MSDLLELLGVEWSKPAPVVACSSEDRLDATHGCRSCGRAPTTWSDVHGGYIDGMGRLTRCGSCGSCAGTGWSLLRDPWTLEPLEWWGAPCLYCTAGWNYHRWDCEGHDDARRREARTVRVWGVTHDGRTFLPGEVVSPVERAA